MAPARGERHGAGYLSHVAEMRHHDYRTPAKLFRGMDATWGPQTVDRFASSDSVQPLLARGPFLLALLPPGCPEDGRALLALGHAGRELGLSPLPTFSPA